MPPHPGNRFDVHVVLEGQGSEGVKIPSLTQPARNTSEATSSASSHDMVPRRMFQATVEKHMGCTAPSGSPDPRGSAPTSFVPLVLLSWHKFLFRFESRFHLSYHKGSMPGFSRQAKKRLLLLWNTSGRGIYFVWVLQKSRRFQEETVTFYNFFHFKKSKKIRVPSMYQNKTLPEQITYKKCLAFLKFGWYTFTELASNIVIVIVIVILAWGYFIDAYLMLISKDSRDF